MLKRLKHFCIAVLIATGPTAALAQTNDGEAGKSSLGFASVITNVASPVTSASSTTASLVDVQDDPRLAGRDTSDIQIQGSIVPSINTGQGRNVRISWTTVSLKSDPRIKRVLPTALETNLIVGNNTKELPTAQALRAAGDTTGLVPSILELLDEANKEDDAPEKTAENSKDDSGSRTSTPTATGSRAEDSDTGSSFKVPDPTPVAAEAAIETPDVGFTTEGCPARLDEVQQVMIIQEQSVTDGVPSGTCEDTLDRLPIQLDFQVCTSDIIDLEARTATGTARRFFVNLQAEPVYIDLVCVAQAAQVFDIVEDGTVCAWQVDAEAETATKLVKLIYNNQNNQRVELTGCQPSTDVAVIATTLNTVACPMRNDFTAGISHEQGRIEWLFNGSVVTDGICNDTGETFAHFEELSGCSYEHNLDTGEAFATSRTAITVDGETVLLDQICAPDPSTTVSLQTTPDGCGGIFVDNFPEQKTFATQRTFFTKPDGTNEFVTGCLMDIDTSFLHQSRVASFLNNDTLQTSTPLEEIFITTANGENVRSPAQLRQGAVPIPYSFVRTDTIDDEVTFAGCVKTTTTLDVEVYERADATIFNLPVGPGDPVGPIDACTSVIQTPIWSLDSKVTSSNTAFFTCTVNGPNGSGEFGGGTATTTVVATYAGTRILQRTDGAAITQHSTKKNNFSFSASNTRCPGGAPSAPSAPTPLDPFNGTEQIAWNQAEGW